MTEGWSLIFRILGALGILLWLFALLRKNYYMPTLEARFLFIFAVVSLAGRLLALWLDVDVFPQWNDGFSRAFNNIVFFAPAMFYFWLGTLDKNQTLSREMTELIRRGEAILAKSERVMRQSNV